MGVTTFAPLDGACVVAAPFCEGIVAGKIAVEIAITALKIVRVAGFIFTGSPPRLIAALGSGSLVGLGFRRFYLGRKLGLDRTSLA